MLAHIFFGLFKQDRRCCPDITYSTYKVYCGLYDIDYRPVPLDDDLAIDPADYTPNGGIIFPNPNAPTGGCYREAVLAANPESVVVIDEAYVDFVVTPPSPWWIGTPTCWSPRPFCPGHWRRAHRTSRWPSC